MTSESKYNISMHGVANFRLVGKGALFNYMAYQYQNFISNAPDNEDMSSDFVVTVSAITPGSDYECALNMGSETFSRSVDGRQFIWTVKNKAVFLDGQKPLAEHTSLLFEPSFNKMKANLLCELFWRLKFVDKGAALIHAACVTREGETILLPAWKSVGKTAVCLKLVAAGSDFLADDRLWLSSDGTALSFPRYVVLKDSNIEHFPEVSSIITKIKLHAFQLLGHAKYLKENSLFKRIRRRLISAKYFHINQLYPQSKVVNESKVTLAVQLTKCRHRNGVELFSANPEQTANMINDIGDVEWNCSLQILAAAHDILFSSGPRWSEELSELINSEKQIVKDALSSVECRVLDLPEDARHLDWGLVTHKLFSQ